MKQPAQILIVEDDVMTATAIEDALIRAGFGVIGIARSYEEALRLIRKKAVNLAIIDVGLGKGLRDGITTAEALLLHQWMPLIYLTGSDDDATFERTKATNTQAFLIKPLDERELVRQVELVLHNVEQGMLNANPAHDEPLYWPTEQGYARIEPADLCYLKAAGNLTIVYLTDEAAIRIKPDPKMDKKLVLVGNLSHWAKNLSTRIFYRLSKSLLINLKYIERIETNQLTLKGHIIPLTEGTRKALANRLQIIGTR